MRIPLWVHAALDGFTLGGLLSTGRPSAPTSIFPEEGHEPEAMAQFVVAYERMYRKPFTQSSVGLHRVLARADTESPERAD